jgi:hypothetical protein
MVKLQTMTVLVNLYAFSSKLLNSELAPSSHSCSYATQSTVTQLSLPHEYMKFGPYSNSFRAPTPSRTTGLNPHNNRMVNPSCPSPYCSLAMRVNYDRSICAASSFAPSPSRTLLMLMAHASSKNLMMASALMTASALMITLLLNGQTNNGLQKVDGDYGNNLFFSYLTTTDVYCNH